MKHIILLILLTLGVWGQEVGVPYVDTREAVAQSAALSPDGEYFYVARNGEISKWSISPIKKIVSLPYENAFRFLLTHDGQKMLLFGEDKSFIVVNLTTNSIEKRVKHNYEIVHAVVTKTSLITLHPDRTLREWDINTLHEKRKILIPKNETLNLPQEEIGYTTDTDRVCAIFPSTDTNTLTIITTTQTIFINRATFQIVNIQTGSCPPIVSINHKNIFDPDGPNFFTIDIDTMESNAQTRYKKWNSKKMVKYSINNKWISHDSAKDFTLACIKEHINIYSNLREQLTAQWYLFSNDNWLIMTPDGYFDGSPEARKYLYMKTSSGESMPIDDATYNKFHKQINLKD